MRSRPFMFSVLALTLLGTSALGGCGGSPANESAAAPATAAARQDGADTAAAPGAAKDAAPAGAAGEAKEAGGVAAVVPKAQVIRTADVVVEVTSLPPATVRVRAVADSLGGSVSTEVTTYPDAGDKGDPADAGNGSSDESTASARDRYHARPGESVLVLKVPVASLDTAIDRVVATGKQLSRSSSARDVTADLADLGSRVKTQQASVDRVRTLMARAEKIQDIVLLESELSRRQADLEALAARQASLADRAALSTLTVTLRTPEATETAQEDPAFVTGLKNGWNALVSSAGVLMIVLGALLPVAVLVAAVGLPIRWFVRRRRP